MTPSPACGPKPILLTARRFPFGGRRPGPPRLKKTPAAVHPLPQGGEGCSAGEGRSALSIRAA